MKVRWLCWAWIATCLFTACAEAPGGSDTKAPDSVLADVPVDAGATDTVAADTAVAVSLPASARAWVGINAFAEAMMGQVPVTIGKEASDFSWLVPHAGGWTLQFHVEHDSAWQPSAAPEWACDDDDPDNGGGTDFPAESFVAGGSGWTKTDKGHTWSAQVGKFEPWSWTAGDNPCGGRVVGRLGGLSAAANVFGHDLPSALDPFDKIDRWLIDFTRDLGTLTVKHGDKGFVVASSNPAKANGVPDFEEALSALGFLGGDSQWKTAFLTHFRERVRQLLWQFYKLKADGGIGSDSVRIQFAFSGDADAPTKPLSQGWSILAVGGEDAQWKTGGQVFFGRAQMDFHNTKQNINTTPNLGIFTTALVRLVLENPALSNLVVDYAPAANGVAFGDRDGDELALQAGLDPKTIQDPKTRERVERFTLVVPLLALAWASVIAHEVGHSIGLVKPGLPPHGLFGGVTKAPWMTAAVDKHHVDTPGLNIMQTGASLKPQDLFAGTPYFAPFNLAYLQRRIVVLK